jgi:hypothetical protein
MYGYDMILSEEKQGAEQYVLQYNTDTMYCIKWEGGG